MKEERTNPDDALLAIEHGVDGIIVSNHGGRQLDGAVATLDMLPLIVRPYIYGLAVAGETGVQEVIEHLIAQTELQLGISGYGSIKALDETCLAEKRIGTTG